MENNQKNKEDERFNHLISEGSYVSTYNILRKATWTATNDRLYWEEG